MRRGRYPRIDPLGAPTKSVFLKLPVATYDELDRQSRRTGVSVPELVRRTLRRVDERDRERLKK